MRRSRRRRRRSLKPIITSVILVLAFAGIAYFLFSSKGVGPSNVAKVSSKNKAEVFFIPISHFTDDTDNITRSELKRLYSTESDSRLYLDTESAESVKRLLDVKDFPTNVVLVEKKEIIETISSAKSSLGLIPVELASPKVKTLSVDGLYFWDKPNGYPLKIDVEDGQEFNEDSITKVTSTGDVMLSRHVATKIRSYGSDYTHPWQKLGSVLKSSDISFINLETPLSDRIPPPTEGMSFIAPTKNMEGLKYAGVDVVALGNNHITNFGVSSLTDTINLLEKNSLSYCGAGNTLSEALSPAIVERNGTKFAFINFNSIVGVKSASENSAGVANLAIKPWTKVDSEEDIAKVKEVVKKAQEKADVVIASFHWGIEYKPYPIDSQIKVAHAAIDSGADLIIGTHPHVVQGLEYYKSPILYSHGNFIFDQEWSTETKQGLISESYFYGNKLVALKLKPIILQDYNQPRLASENEKIQILDRIFDNSLGVSYQN